MHQGSRNVMNDIKTANIFKIASIICFSLITIAMIIAWNTPAIGYEYSIYAFTPLIVWISIGISILLGISIILHQLWTGNYKNSNYLLIVGFTLVLLSSIICLSLYIIRGYFLWDINADPGTHLGYANSIMNTGFVPDYLFYPILHVYTSIFSLLTGFTTYQLSIYLPLFFSLIFLVFMYVLSKSVLPKRGEVISATLISMAFIYGWYLNFTPNHAANFLFPMALFIIIMTFTKNRYQWSILLVITAILYPAFHLVPALALLIIIGSLTLPNLIFKLKTKKSLKFPNAPGNLKTTATLLMAVLSITWISSFYVWNKTIKNIYTLVTEGGTTHLDKLAATATSAQTHFFEAVILSVKYYSADVIIILISLISFPIIWKKLKENKNYVNLFSLYGPLTMFFGFVIVLYFLNLIFSPNRMLVYIIYLGTFLSGFFLYMVLKKSKDFKRTYIQKVVPIFIFLILAGIFLNSILILYPSPYLKSPNEQTTHMEYDGMKWYFDNGQISTNVSLISIERKRYADLFNPNLTRTKTPYRYSNEFTPPAHFNYNQSLTEGAKWYLLLDKKDEDIYKYIYPEDAFQNWYPSDFGKLDDIMYINKIYSNGEFDVRYLNTTMR